MYNHIVGKATAREQWMVLEVEFSLSSRSIIMELKSLFQYAVKGNLPVSNYVSKIKTVQS